MKRNKRNVSMLVVSVFMIGASILMASCDNLAEMPKELKSYFKEENAKEELKEEYRVNFETDKSKTQICFSEDGKTLLIPPYQDAEKIFAYNEDDITYLNSDSGDALWIRINMFINSSKMDMYPLQALRMYKAKGCVLYVLYLVDFINVYQKKCPEVVNMKNAPTWFKQLLAERRANPSFAKTDAQIAISNLTVKAKARNRKITVSWDESTYLGSVSIEYASIEDSDNKTKKDITDMTKKEFIIDNLENYKAYEIMIGLLDKNNVKAKSKRFVVTPCTGNENEDYAQGPSDFTEENGDKFIKPEYKIKISWRLTKKQIIFSTKKGNSILFPMHLQEAEKVFNYSKKEIAYTDFPNWGRLSHVLKKGFSANSSVNEYGGNVRWILGLADFFNVYQAKCTDLVDLSNAPKWFTDLMAKRKADGKSLAKAEYK